MEWGRLKESEALRDYKATLPLDVKVEAAGLMPDLSRELGGSPDGLIKGMGRLLEIKCPYSCREEGQLKEKIVSGTWYIKKNEEGKSVLNLKSSQGKQYYHQMQGCMYCFEWPTSCDFFVWTPYEYCLLNIPKDSEWAKKHVPKLRAVWKKYGVEEGEKKAEEKLQITVKGEVQIIEDHQPPSIHEVISSPYFDQPLSTP